MGVCESTKRPKKDSYILTYSQNRESKRINTNLNEIERNSKFERNTNQHNSVEQSSNIKLYQIDIKLKTESNVESKFLPQTTQNNESDTFKRKENRRMSLVEKNNIGNRIFKEEMKLKVTPQTLVEESKGLPTTKYKVLSKLGDGSYGTVYLSINQITKGQVAMKRIAKIDYTQEGQKAHGNSNNKNEEVNEELKMKNEIDILKKLDHPNIVKIIEFYSTNSAYYIINDYCPHGELYSQIKYKFSEIQLAVLFYQIFSGLFYLHDNNICHRDLKLENILISDIEKDLSTGLNYFWIKIIDFGTATIFKKNKNEKAIVGSSYYIAPEVLKKKYNEKCDTWSAGVILHMLIVGKAPFDGSNDNQIITRIRKGLFNTQNEAFLNSSPEAQDLIIKLLEVNPEKRLSAKEALQHPWFKKYNAKRLYSNISNEKMNEYLQRLLSYKISSKFQQIVLAFIVHNLPSNEETKDILKIFRLFNSSNNGRLTKNEFKEGLNKYMVHKNINTQTINDLFMILDGSNNGYIEYEEFLRACLDKKSLFTDDILAYAYNFIDKDNTNRITVSKIKECFKETNASDELFQFMFQEVHQEENGSINYVEFKEKMLDM